MHRLITTASLGLILLTACAPASATDLAIESILTHALADTFARDALRELCDEVGPRLSGSDGMVRAHAWAQRRLREAGCDSVWLEPVTVPRWQRGVEWARLTAPYDAPLTMIGLGLSDGDRKSVCRERV